MTRRPHSRKTIKSISYQVLSGWLAEACVGFLLARHFSRGAARAIP